MANVKTGWIVCSVDVGFPVGSGLTYGYWPGRKGDGATGRRPAGRHQNAKTSTRCLIPTFPFGQFPFTSRSTRSGSTRANRTMRCHRMNQSVSGRSLVAVVVVVNHDRHWTLHRSRTGSMAPHGRASRTWARGAGCTTLRGTHREARQLRRSSSSSVNASYRIMGSSRDSSCTPHAHPQLQCEWCKQPRKLSRCFIAP
jgi:hypothetical protein